MTQTMNLPQGMTPQMIHAALAFLATQTVKSQMKPSGLLPANMIRGVDPGYQYEFRPYPKAVYPPDVMIADAEEEKKLRVQWNRKLPWPVNDPVGQENIREYYARQEYPKRETPPPIIVEDENAEAMLRAQWQAEYGESGARIYPAWMFHPSKGALPVNSLKDEERLGPGWYQTPEEAMNAARGIKAPVQASDEIERSELFKLAEELGVHVDARYKTPRIKQMVDEARATKAGRETEI